MESVSKAVACVLHLTGTDTAAGGLHKGGADKDGTEAGKGAGQLAEAEVCKEVWLPAARLQGTSQLNSIRSRADTLTLPELLPSSMHRSCQV